jgi:glutamine amidotransferase
MYFVHSFYVELAESEQPASVTSYAGVDYVSSVNKGNLFACQFHPEKSAWNGLKVYHNFKRKVTGELL